MWSAAGDRLFGMCGAQTAPLLPLSLPLSSAVNQISRALHSSLGLGSLLERHLYRAPLGSRTSGLGVVWASLGSCFSILKSRLPGEYSNIFKKNLVDRVLVGPRLHMVLRSGKLRSSVCVKEKGHGKGVCLDLILGPLHSVQQLDAGPYSGLVLCAQKTGGWAKT